MIISAKVYIPILLAISGGAGVIGHQYYVEHLVQTAVNIPIPDPEPSATPSIGAPAIQDQEHRIGSIKNRRVVPHPNPW